MSQETPENRQEEYNNACASLLAALEDTSGDNVSELSEFQPQALRLRLPWNFFYPPRGLETKLVKRSFDAGRQTLLQRVTSIQFHENVIRSALLKISEINRSVIAITLTQPFLSILDRVEEGFDGAPKQGVRWSGSPLQNQRRDIHRWLDQIVHGDLEQAFAGVRHRRSKTKPTLPTRTAAMQKGFAGLLQDWQTTIERDDPGARSFLDGILPDDVGIELRGTDSRLDPAKVNLWISAKHATRTKSTDFTRSHRHYVRPLINQDLFWKPVRKCVQGKLDSGVPLEKVIDRKYLKKNNINHQSWSASLINALQKSERATIAEYVLATETLKTDWLHGIVSTDPDRDAFDFLELEHQCSIIRDGRISGY